MIWRDVIDLGLSSCGAGGSPDVRASNLRFRLASEAQRRIASAVRIPELFTRKALKTVANQDWIPTPSDLYAVSWIQNRDSGIRLTQEPEGSLGRSRFFEADQDRPATGTMDDVNFYWREGERIYLRDTPNEIGILDIEYRFHTLEVKEADLDREPVLPEQMHFHIATVFSGLYYALHPPLDPSTQIPMVSFGEERIGSALKQILGVQQDPRSEEALDARRILYQPGYTMGGCR